MDKVKVLRQSRFSDRGKDIQEATEEEDRSWVTEDWDTVHRWEESADRHQVYVNGGVGESQTAKCK